MSCMGTGTNIRRAVANTFPKSAWKNAAASLSTGATQAATPSPKVKSQATKRKYTSYRKMESEQDQDLLDEILVTMVMDKPQISNPKIGAEHRTKELQLRGS